MRTQLSKLALTAIFGFALTLTLSCSSDDGGKDSSGDKIEYGYVEDDDGQVYKTVKIGDQTWMAENLNYDVPKSPNYSVGSFCYNDNSANCNRFGHLYDWATAMAMDPDSSCNRNKCGVGAKHRGICPKDWHIPSDEEWTKLIDYIGDDKTASKYLRASEWGGNDKYGFAALPGGMGINKGINMNASFSSVGEYGFWWSTRQADGGKAYSRRIEDNDRGGYVITNDDSKWSLYSVRCIKD